MDFQEDFFCYNIIRRKALSLLIRFYCLPYWGLKLRKNLKFSESSKNTITDTILHFIRIVIWILSDCKSIDDIQTSKSIHVQKYSKISNFKAIHTHKLSFLWHTYESICDIHCKKLAGNLICILKNKKAFLFSLTF